MEQEILTDLHVHSGYARAVSKEMTLENLDAWAAKKGITIVGAPDFTHPKWFPELQEKLIEDGSGLLTIRNGKGKFLLGSEISCIYTEKGKGRRVHVVVFAPSLKTVEKLNAQLNLRGNLASDGRPIIGISVHDLTDIVLNADERCVVIPAHIWTPWFGVYGSNSGFDALAECFGDLTDRIPAVETGLSSDPPMNWRVAELDTKSIVSFSDAHSPANLGREATGFHLAELTYDAIAEALRIPFPTKAQPNRITQTIEFHPEEGMYHFDGHRNCGVRWSPAETKKRKGVCPKCGRQVVVGVMNRVEVLADRPEGYRAERRPGYTPLIPLREAIAEAHGVGKAAKSVRETYETLVAKGDGEMNVLLRLPIEDIARLSDARVGEAVARVREGKLEVTPGYDGTYGIVKIFAENERMMKKPQPTLFS